MAIPMILVSFFPDQTVYSVASGGRNDTKWWLPRKMSADKHWECYHQKCPWWENNRLGAEMIQEK